MFLDGPVLRIQGSIKRLNLFPHLSCKHSRTDKYFKGGEGRAAAAGGREHLTRNDNSPSLDNRPCKVDKGTFAGCLYGSPIEQTRKGSGTSD